MRRRRSAKLFGGRHLCQIWTNQRRAARTRSALGGLPKKSCSRFALRCSRKKSSKIFSACGGLSLSALTIWRLWRAARSCGLHSKGIHQNIRLRHRTQTRKYVAISSFCHCKSKFFGACGELRSGNFPLIDDTIRRPSSEKRAYWRRALRRGCAPQRRF